MAPSPVRRRPPQESDEQSVFRGSPSDSCGQRTRDGATSSAWHLAPLQPGSQVHTEPRPDVASSLNRPFSEQASAPSPAAAAPSACGGSGGMGEVCMAAAAAAAALCAVSNSAASSTFSGTRGDAEPGSLVLASAVLALALALDLALALALASASAVLASALAFSGPALVLLASSRELEGFNSVARSPPRWRILQ